MVHFVQIALCILLVFMAFQETLPSCRAPLVDALAVSQPEYPKGHPAELHLKATLRDPDNSDIVGHATYVADEIIARFDRTFSATINGAPANSRLDVLINSYVVGTLKTDAAGSGTMSADTTAPDFPKHITFGDIVSVGSAKGALISSEPIFADESIATSSRDIGLILRR
jgi:hypothetical protein